MQREKIKSSSLRSSCNIIEWKCMLMMMMMSWRRITSFFRSEDWNQKMHEHSIYTHHRSRDVLLAICNKHYPCDPCKHIHTYIYIYTTTFHFNGSFKLFGLIKLQVWLMFVCVHKQHHHHQHLHFGIAPKKKWSTPSNIQ